MLYISLHVSYLKSSHVFKVCCFKVEHQSNNNLMHPEVCVRCIALNISFLLVFFIFGYITWLRVFLLSGVRMYTRIKLLSLKEAQLAIYIYRIQFSNYSEILEYAYEHRCKRGGFFCSRTIVDSITCVPPSPPPHTHKTLMTKYMFTESIFVFWLHHQQNISRNFFIMIKLYDKRITSHLHD